MVRVLSRLIQAETELLRCIKQPLLLPKLIKLERNKANRKCSQLSEARATTHISEEASRSSSHNDSSE